MYEELVVPTYFFGGFQLVPRQSTLLEWGLIAGAAIVMPLRIDNMTRMFVWLSFLFILMPATALSAQQSSDREALLIMYAATLSVVLIAFVAASLTSRSADRGCLGVNSFSPLAYAILLFYACVLVAAWLIHGGIKTFNFSEVYEHRFDFNDAVVFPMNYFIPITGGALSSLVMAYSLVSKRYALAGLLLVFGFFLFGITTHKLYIFYPFMAVLFYFLVRMGGGLLYLLAGLIAVSLLAVATTHLDVDVFGNTFANRTIFLPAQIHFEYFKEFSDVGFQYWAESKFGFGLAESRLSVSAVYHIGGIMTGDYRIGANTGWIANGYMNLGVFGVGVYAIILGFLLFILDGLGRAIDYPFVLASTSGVLLFIVANSDLLTTLLTGGLFVSIMVLIFYKRLARRSSSGLLGKN